MQLVLLTNTIGELRKKIMGMILLSFTLKVRNDFYTVVNGVTHVYSYAFSQFLA